MIVSTMNWLKEGLQDDGTYVAYKYYANSTRVKTYVVLRTKPLTTSSEVAATKSASLHALT